MTNTQRRLYRSRNNKVIAGVCGGLSEYLNVDTTIIRIIWILFTFLGGSGIIAYLLAYFVVPLKPVDPNTPAQEVQSDFSTARVLGIVFVVIGAVILLDNLDILSFHRWWDMSWEFLFPGLLILGGIYFLTRQETKREPLENQTQQTEAGPQLQDQPPPSREEKAKPKVLHRSLANKKILGICGGAGEYFDIDPTIIRIGYTIFTLLSGGMGIILYFIMFFIIPADQS